MANKPCPFCGGVVDPTGWLSGGYARGPECEGCGATAPTIEVWNRRQDELMSPDISADMSPEQAFEHHVANPNLFRSLATRLHEYAIFTKVAGFPMEEGDIGPDCARAALLLNALAYTVEESQDGA